MNEFQYTPQEAGTVDRITQILQSRAPTPQQISIQDLGNIASGRGTDFFGLQQAAQDRELQGQQTMFQMFEAKRAAGDRNAQAIHEQVSKITSDPDAQARLIEAMGNDPESITPQNALIKAARYTRELGIEPDYVRTKRMADLEEQKTRAEIGKLNRVDATGDGGTAEMKNYLMGKKDPEFAQFLQQKKEKPMPPSIAKQQDELLGELAISNNLETDLQASIDVLDSGGIDLGPINNQMLKLRNSGWIDSTPESRNAANLMATLQKQRNDSLRLNKGTQTEFDAARAWSELLGSDEENPTLPKDEKLLSSGLKRIQGLNKRASMEKNIRIDRLREDYGKESIDTSDLSQPNPSYQYEKAGALPPDKQRRLDELRAKRDAGTLK